MIQSRVTVRSKGGLPLRLAAKLVRLARRFRSQIRLRLGTCMVDPRSILSIVLLSASLGTQLEIEVSGVDEREAIQALEDFFGDPGLDDISAADIDLVL